MRIAIGMRTHCFPAKMGPTGFPFRAPWHDKIPNKNFWGVLGQTESNALDTASDKAFLLFEAERKGDQRVLC